MGIFSRRDKDGYDKKGYDKKGYDKKGYDKEGYDKGGYDKDWYDKDGYHKYGYNKDGYNRGGYDRYGFNLDGYNRYGFNFDRIHKVTGTKYDQTGYPDPTEIIKKFIIYGKKTITRLDHDYEQEVLDREQDFLDDKKKLEDEYWADPERQEERWEQLREEHEEEKRTKEEERKRDEDGECECTCNDKSEELDES